MGGIGGRVLDERAKKDEGAEIGRKASYTLLWLACADFPRTRFTWKLWLQQQKQPTDTLIYLHSFANCRDKWLSHLQPEVLDLQ